MGIATFPILDLEIKLVEADDRNVYHLLKHGYESSSLELWAKLIKPGATVLDVGAYTGLYSMIAAKRGASVVALEPMPANFRRLRLNAHYNGVKITTLNAAASDYEGTAVLNYNPKVTLTTGASLKSGIHLHHAQIIVRCITLDSLNLENVTAIKVDVEWHEPCVLWGAMQTIARDGPSLLVETLDGDMREQILKLLPGYQIAAILDSRNTFFIPR
jgi:FkbM family methyltransferase